MKAIDDVIAHISSKSNEKQAASTPKKRFRPSNVDFFHRMIQSVNREQYSAKTVFTTNLHIGILNEWLTECLHERNGIFPTCALLELMFASGLKSRLLFGDDADPEKTVWIKDFILIKNLLVSSDPSAVTCIFCVVSDEGDISVLKKTEVNGKSDLICTCTLISSDECSLKDSIGSELKSVSLTKHTKISKSYFVPPLLLQEVLDKCNVPANLAKVSAFRIDKSKLNEFWKYSVCKYRVFTKDSKKVVEMLTYSDALVMHMEVSTDEETSISGGTGSVERLTLPAVIVAESAPQSLPTPDAPLIHTIVSPTPPPAPVPSVPSASALSEASLVDPLHYPAPLTEPSPRVRPYESCHQWTHDTTYTAAVSATRPLAMDTAHLGLTFQKFLLVSENITLSSVVLPRLKAATTAAAVKSKSPAPQVFQLTLTELLKLPASGTAPGAIGFSKVQFDVAYVVISQDTLCFLKDASEQAITAGHSVSLQEWLAALTRLCGMATKVLFLVTEFTHYSPHMTDSAALSAMASHSLVASLVCAVKEYPKCDARIAYLLTATDSSGTASREKSKADFVFEVVCSETTRWPQNEMEVLYTATTAATAQNSTAPLPYQRSVKRYEEIYMPVAAVLPVLNERDASNGVLPISSLPTPPPAALTGVFVITGGLGALGLQTAKLLLDLGATQIVLVSRSGKVSYSGQGLEEQMAEVLAHKNSSGKAVDVKVVLCDVSVESEVVQMLENVRASMGRISGVIHSAGVLSDCLLKRVHTNAEHFAECASKVWAAKTLSAYYLHKHTANDDIQYMVIYSSISAAIGNISQTVYSIANKFCEELMLYRAAHNKQQAQSNERKELNVAIRWPAVAAVGMAAALKTKQQATTGVAANLQNEYDVSVEYVTDILQRIFSCSAIVPVDRAVTAASSSSLLSAPLNTSVISIQPLSMVPPLVARDMIVAKEFSKITDAHHGTKPEKPVGVLTSASKSLTNHSTAAVTSVATFPATIQPPTLPPVIPTSTPAAARTDTARVSSTTFVPPLPPTAVQAKQGRWSHDQIVGIVRSIIFALTDRTNVGDGEHLLEIGIDSMNITEIAMKVNEKFRLKLSPLVIFDFPTITQLSDYLSTVLASAAPAIVAELYTSEPLAVFADTSSAVSSMGSATTSPTNSSTDASHLPDVEIVGQSCRFPGDINSMEALWEVLRAGKSVSGAAPKSRWDSDAVIANLICTTEMAKQLQRIKYGSFLSDNVLESFSPAVFGISHQEAERMDVAQRLLLQVSYEALLDANYTPEEVTNKVVGVFVGASGTFGTSNSPVKGVSNYNLSVYDATSSTLSVASGRISFALGFTGPSLTIDTACSSSLVALHSARRALQLGECDLALVAGVNILDLQSSVAVAVAGMTSVDGQCHTFDASANGYGRGEGCAAIILRRVDADSPNGKSYGVVRGSAVLQDGVSASLTAPNGHSQQALHRRTLEDAGLEAGEVSLLETHGTGTPLGDPVETNAIGVVYGRSTPGSSQQLHLTAVKANLGHLEAAAGMAGLFSVLCALKHKSVAPVAGLKTLNDKVKASLENCENVSISLGTRVLNCDRGRPIVAAVSSFGYSGTIAQVLLQEGTNSSRNTELSADVLVKKAELISGLVRFPLPTFQLAQAASSTVPDSLDSTTNVENKYKVSRDQVRSVVHSTVCSFLSSAAVDPHAEIMSLGMDSLQCAELAIKLADLLGCNIPVTLIFSYSTVHQIVEYILSEFYTNKIQNGEEKATTVVTSKEGSGSTVTVTTTTTVSTTTTTTAPKSIATASSSIQGGVLLEDVAIIGVAMKLPGGCNSLSSLWSMLVDKKSTAVETPRDRWDAESTLERHNLRDPLVKARLKKAHFLTDREPFVESDFKLTHNEASTVHDQQKLLLQTVKKALVDCGYVGDKICANTGVFVGVSGLHSATGTDNRREETISGHSATSNSTSVSAGRISFTFGLTGPCMAIDTACSSSLVALHSARRALQLGECDLAIVAGVNILDLQSSLAVAVAGMTSVDGQCHTFDASANGYARGEGCGVVVLKRASEASKDGDGVYATIKGSAVQQDGSSASLTAPNALAQQQLLKAALRDGKLQPNQLQYIEAHGTATSLGDPVETSSLAAVFGQNRGSNPLHIACVKPNVGHLEAGAGMAGLFSVLAALHHSAVPPNAQLKTLNANVEKSVAGTALQFPTALTPLQRVADHPLLAGLSSFGYSGTIAHVILQEAAMPHPSFATEQLRLTELASALEEESPSAGVVWQFSGQGSLKCGAGRDIYNSTESFRVALAECDALMLKYAQITASELLYPDLTGKHTSAKAESLLTETMYSQPILVVLEYCLAVVFRETGSAPDMVLGHSLGEYTAAIVSGVMTLEECVMLVCARGAMIQKNAKCMGVMYAVRTTEEVALATLMSSGLSATVSLAAVNGPNSVVVSGSNMGVTRCLKLLPPNTPSIKLQVLHAFHSPLLQNIVSEYTAVLQKINLKEPNKKMHFVSTVRGCEVTTELTTIQYWLDHLLLPVRYMTGIEYAYDKHGRTFIEMGPQSTLTKLTKPILVAKGVTDFADCEILSCVE